MRGTHNHKRRHSGRYRPHHPATLPVDLIYTNPRSRLRIALLGGTGPGGRAATAALRAAGHTALTLARGLTGPAPDEVCDRRDADRLARLLADFAPDVLIDHVAYTLEEVEAALAALPDLTARYVLVSSAVVYGPTRERPYAETEALAPNPGVPAAKAAADAAARSRPGGVAIRLGALYGPGHDPFTPWGRDPTLFDRMRRGESILLPRTDARVQPWYAGDHGQLLLAIVEHPSPPPALNAASEESMTWREVLTAWAAAADAPPPTFESIDVDVFAAGVPAYMRPFVPMLLAPPRLDLTRLRAFAPSLFPTMPTARGFAKASRRCPTESATESG